MRLRPFINNDDYLKRNANTVTQLAHSLEWLLLQHGNKFLFYFMKLYN